MKENDGSGMDPCQELVEGLLFGGLVILVPVYIGETPEKRLVSEVLCHLQVLCAVFSLRRSVIVRHLLPGHLGKKRGVVVHLFLERGKIRDRRHIGMMIGMVPHRMSLRHHPLGNLRRALQKMSHHKESGRRLVLF